MSIITISRSFCSRGKQLAEQLANELGYECVSREILIEASEQFDIPEIQLAKAIHDGPSFFERFSHDKEKYIAFIRAALLNHLKNDNVVYHGLAGHFFIQNMPHILKIRTLTDMESRIKEEMDRENTSAILARKQLLFDDKQRQNWSKFMYRMDTSDPELYDLVLNLKNMSINDCVKIIQNTIELEKFQLSDEAKKFLQDEALAASVKAVIVEKYYDSTVTAHDGQVTVKIECLVPDPEQVKAEIHELLEQTEGIKTLNIITISSALSPTAMHK